MYGRSPDECIANYNKAIGTGTVRVRPNSISEFVVTVFTPWQAKQVQKDSLSRYDVAWRNHIGPAFGHLLFSELTANNVQDGLLRKGLSPASIGVGRTLLSSIIKLAIAEGRATADRLVLVDIAKQPAIRKRKRSDIVSVANILLEKARGDWMEGPIWVAATIGLRKGEICGMKITDIREDHILIKSQRNHTSGDRDQLKHREAGDTKPIGLPKWMIEKLRSYHRPGSIYLFTKPDGKPISYQHFVREMDRNWLGRPIKNKEKRPEGAPTAHDLRSAAIVSLIEAGVNDHTIIDIVGQSAVEIIREYRDESITRSREAMSKVTNVYDNHA